MSWIYKNNEINSLEQVPEGAVGFIYKITNIRTSKFYIGKKQLYSTRRTKISKREKEATSTRKTFKITTTESDWLTYFSSCVELKKEKQQIGEDSFEREIIEFCFNKRDLNYKEVWWQFHLDVLANNTYNGNIASRWFKPKENEQT